MEYITDVEELSQPSIEIKVEDNAKKIKEIVHELQYRMGKDNLTALSAPQIGEKYRIFCIKFVNGKNKKKAEVIHTFINPVALGIKGFVIDREEDVCLPNKQFLIPRSNDINIIYQDTAGKTHTQRYSGKAAAVIQHMIDHLDGVLLSDMGLEIDGRFDEATDEEKNELLQAYMDSLSAYKDEMNSYIESNKDLKDIRDAVTFIQSVREGVTSLGSPITVDTSELAEKSNFGN